jgi:hypothetical protein
MSIPLVPCPSCARHVRCSEESCPFCKSAIPAGLVPVPRAPHRLARGAAFMFASTLVAVTGCSSDTTTTTPPTDAVADDGSPAPKYGLPSDSAFDADDVLDDGTPVVKYGGPPVDSGPDTTGDTDTDTGSPAPKYGLPADTGAG